MYTIYYRKYIAGRVVPWRLVYGGGGHARPRNYTPLSALIIPLAE